MMIKQTDQTTGSASADGGDEEIEGTLSTGRKSQNNEVDHEHSNDDNGHEELDPDPLPERAIDALPEQPEQIGSLIFVGNREYPYPFKVAKPPRFWMEETTGTLAEAVEAYLNGERLRLPQLAVIKIYLKQFVERAVLTGDAKIPLLHSKIDRIKTAGDVANFADEVAELGAEVF
ncbi:MAG: hypothetical protein NVSMB42_01060 [Herpetosiphon sp.]